jgi:hypothetical protein
LSCFAQVPKSALVHVDTRPLGMQELRDKYCFGAAQAGDLAKVCGLLQAGVQPSAYEDESGVNSLLVAAQGGHDQVVGKLWVDVDFQTKAGQASLIGKGGTALMFASLEGHVKVVALLVEKKANFEVQSTTQNTALCLASIRGHVSIVERLLAAGAAVDIRGEGGATALMKACYNGNREVAAALLAAGADMNMRSTGGDQAFRWAQKQGHQCVQALLLGHGFIPKETAAAASQAAHAAKKAPPTKKEWTTAASCVSLTSLYTAVRKGELRRTASVSKDAFSRTSSAASSASTV